ncbi:hypothetical protein ETAE_1028 [Edwardsiella piscicida]|uniref:Uncharacterized protein n=1 Tax=Edwardsiella piscicida TaxID=1263550 RepID=A0AAU8PCE2_EDWPI|nr:hypothetical protein ETAE_1028 [Edwardsiella tarda EIB202]
MQKRNQFIVLHHIFYLYDITNNQENCSLIMVAESEKGYSA